MDVSKIKKKMKLFFFVTLLVIADLVFLSPASADNVNVNSRVSYFYVGADGDGSCSFPNPNVWETCGKGEFDLVYSQVQGKI